MGHSHSTPIPKNDARIMTAWTVYDWANSVYNLVITTAIFPLYYTNATQAAFGGDIVQFFGIEIKNSILYSYAISFSFFIIAILAPLLSGIADYGGRKKTMMQVFTYIGSTACISLFFFEGKNVEQGIISAIFASIGYAGGLVFYNAFLPEIATEDRIDTLSARGYSMGYAGSVALLILNLIMIQKFEAFGFENSGQAARFSFLTVGIWWAGFAQFAFLRLRNVPKHTTEKVNIFLQGFKELAKVAQSLPSSPTILKFLLSFFFYSTGVQTVMLLAPTFAKQEVKVSDSGLLIIVLIIQVIAIAGAYCFALLSNKKGNKFTIGVMLLIWVVVCVIAYSIQTEQQFYGLAVLVGIVMGGIQSMSRSTYSKLIPENTPDTASYFSFYDVTEKISIVMGTFSFGFIEQMTGSMRNSALVLIVFFVIGFLVLLRLPFIGHKK